MADVDASGNVIDNRRYVVDASGNSLECVDVSGSVVEHVGTSDEIEVVAEIKEDVGKTGFVSDTKWIDSDGIGYLELVDCMGDDLMAVNCARVSFNKSTDVMTPRDEKLIKYLANHGHISVFFHAQLQFRIKMPIFSARQFAKHQAGHTINECSGRYVTMEKEFWIPSETEIRAKADNVKQGSASHPPAKSEEAHLVFKESVDASFKAYERLVELGVCNEQARAVLPQGMYTYFISTMSLCTAFRIYKLRTDAGAQVEIGRFGRAIGTIAEKKFPLCWKALKEAEGIE